MSEKPSIIQRFDNYPEAKLALGNVKYPILIKPGKCDNPMYFYEAKDFGKAIQVLYDAFEHSSNNRIVIESY